MPLTEIKLKNLKPKDKQYKISDEKGLRAVIYPHGGKYWQLKYRYGGKEKSFSIGVYPEISLKEARIKAEDARKLIREGIDPSQKKQEVKRAKLAENQNSLENIAREWYETQKRGWTERHAKYVMRRLELDLFPTLGHKAINEIKPLDLLAALKTVEKRGALDIARRLLQTTGQIYRYAVIHGNTTYDITSGLAQGLSKPQKKKHYASLDEKDLPEFINKIQNYDGEPLTKLALNLILLTFVRTSELRGARWEEIDLDKKQWVVPAERMKMSEKHIVPLSKQAINVINEVAKFTGEREFLFTHRTNPTKCMSNNTMLYAMYRMGFHSRATVHGFRATASTILNEHGFRSDVIERQLAHAERNKVRASYNHAQYLNERTDMMQWWGDYLGKRR